jgi:hypothetical protein
MCTRTHTVDISLHALVQVWPLGHALVQLLDGVELFTL